MLLIDDKGRRVSLGNELGRGGEATIYAVADNPRLVAKVYHRPLTGQHAEKLARMVALQTERLLGLTAWPTALLRANDASGIAGILMKNLSGLKDIHLLYGPKSRVREFPPKADWSFLLHTAGNVARAFSVIHGCGHVIGDVNESNVKVSPDSAIVNLIDCDSFQIESCGRYFFCEVGKPEYTPPELQGKQFKNVVRTPNHDNFGLATLIFHLLFMGRHPFAGRFLGRGDMPPAKAIGEFRFAFAPDAQRTQMEPPPNSLTLSQLSPTVAALFVAAFAPSGAQSGRPTGAQWTAALECLGRELRQCSVNPSHKFFRGLSACPWCDIEMRAGIVLFISATVTSGASAFNFELVRMQLAAVHSLGPPTLPDFDKLTAHVRATSSARSAGWRRRGQVFVIVALTALILLGCLIAGLGGLVLWIGIAGVFVVSKVAGAAGRPKAKFVADRNAAEARLRGMQERWSRDASEAPFVTRLGQLNALIEEHKKLPSLRQHRMMELQRNLYASQLEHFLEGFDVARAVIPHIKDGRKAMLRSYGIDDAADVTEAAIRAIPGFGDFLTQQMLDWRRSHERTFRFDPNRGVAAADIQKLDQIIAKRRAEIELILSRGHIELSDINRKIAFARGALQTELQKAWMEVAQARANERAA